MDTVVKDPLGDIEEGEVPDKRNNFESVKTEINEDVEEYECVKKENVLANKDTVKTLNSKVEHNYKILVAAQKSHKCSECDYATKNRRRLKIHVLNHFGEKPYKCGICDYSCNKAYNLKTHSYTHTAQRIFAKQVGQAPPETFFKNS